MSDKLEMPIDQFAEAVAKENAQLVGLNEKLKEQTKLYFHAFNKAAARIEELEAALRYYAKEYENTFGGDDSLIARKALERKYDR
jgi:hypothetical protein